MRIAATRCVGVGLHRLKGQCLQRPADIVHLIVFQLRMVGRLSEGKFAVDPTEYQSLIANRDGGDPIMADVHNIPIQP